MFTLIWWVFRNDLMLGHLGQIEVLQKKTKPWKWWFPTFSKTNHRMHSHLVYVLVRWVFRYDYIFPKVRPSGDREMAQNLVSGHFLEHRSISNILYIVIREILWTDSIFGHVGLILALWWPSLCFHSLRLDLRRGRASSDALCDCYND